MDGGTGGDIEVEGLRAMARGFRSFAESIRSRSQWTSTEDTCHWKAEVFDSWPQKLAAWRSALYVSSMVLHADLEITGTSSNSPSGGSCLLQPGRLLVGHL